MVAQHGGMMVGVVVIAIDGGGVDVILSQCDTTNVRYKCKY